MCCLHTHSFVLFPGKAYVKMLIVLCTQPGLINKRFFSFLAFKCLERCVMYLMLFVLHQWHFIWSRGPSWALNYRAELWFFALFFFFFFLLMANELYRVKLGGLTRNCLIPVEWAETAALFTLCRCSVGFPIPCSFTGGSRRAVRWINDSLDHAFSAKLWVF